MIPWGYLTYRATKAIVDELYVEVCPYCKSPSIKRNNGFLVVLFRGIFLLGLWPFVGVSIYLIYLLFFKVGIGSIFHLSFYIYLFKNYLFYFWGGYILVAIIKVKALPDYICLNCGYKFELPDHVRQQ